MAKPDTKRRQPTTGRADSRLPSGTSPTTKKSMQVVNKTKKASKFAKPKHLKRKLETISPDDPRHEHVLGQLKDFEHQKQQYLQKHHHDDVAAAALAPSAERQAHASKLVESRKLISKPSADRTSERLKDEKPIRQRGQRRRGRKDTSTTTVTDQPTLETPLISPEPDVTTGDSNLIPSDPEGSTSSRELKRRSIKRQGDPRYCVGRQPVTDFEIGSKHDGKVVYVKPFGVFIDIGCHSDAFCHVSRLSDDFVENPEAMFQPGDEIKGVRIVETDRQTKRITVSLQSDKRIDDEKLSLESKQNRMKKRRTDGPSKDTTGWRQARSASSAQPIIKDERIESIGDLSRNESKAELHFPHPVVEPGNQLSTKEQLKRQQKLERRAARREQQQALSQ